MTIELATADGERELSDRDLVGEWSEALSGLCSAGSGGPWGVYIARDEGQLVGVGLFKGGPDEHGWVEFAYLTFIPHRGRGVARGIAAALVKIATDHGAVGIRAHTLPEENSSTGVLRRTGFTCLGVVTDPEDGEVWRWERPC